MGILLRLAEDRGADQQLSQLTVPIEDKSEGGHGTGFVFDIHFIALFSKKADAAPLLLLHGWPGSFLEFLGALDVLKSNYSPETLPFHVIVPGSLPGYGYSSGPPLDRDFTTEGMAHLMNKLMVGLGFGNGYISQGGDIGSFISRVFGVKYPECKAVHLHLCIGQQGEMEGLTNKEKKGVERYKRTRACLSSNIFSSWHETPSATADVRCGLVSLGPPGSAPQPTSSGHLDLHSRDGMIRGPHRTPISTRNPSELCPRIWRSSPSVAAAPH
ncbi:hypothetical protein TI39_contig422g00002 [Zymoseptoria brevis]|uniref:AB hydrolase-1 domain-containing protein n=1 Tax=Zymoseptoria brevis TaxID=1047168 RepID=A0A0F4GLG1_9PEZI|nr:hypothetical protein TI39_contig422g00002 [Zymoseptoria brevis]